MAHKYEAHAHNGKVYNVTTDKHHSELTDEQFKAHLGRIIDSTFSTVAGGIILRTFIYKGRV